MKLKILFTLTVAAGILLCGCGGDKASNEQSTDMELQATGAGGNVVTDVIHAGKYTYVEVKHNNESLWAAAPHFEVEVGDEVALPTDMMPMQNWHSESLDRTWDVVYFASAITKVGDEMHGSMSPHGHGDSENGDLADALDFSGITPPSGGQTVAQLYAKKAEMAGHPVTVRGLVVKVTTNVMDKNWLHVRDGSGGMGTNDLAVTTQALPKVGDTVLVKGSMDTDVDFGAGYFFDIIVQDADVTIE